MSENKKLKQDIFISTNFLNSIPLNETEKKIVKRIMPFAKKEIGMIKLSESIVRSIAFQLNMDHEDADRALRIIKSKRKNYELKDRAKVQKRALKETFKSLREQTNS